MTIEELKKKKIEKGYTNEQLAELSGVPLGTVQKIFAGVTKAPRYATIRALEQVLVMDLYTYDTTWGKALAPVRNVFCESALEYGNATKTIKDYYALSDGERAELIDGVLYDMAAPSTAHQYLVGEVYSAFKQYVKKNKGKCIPFLSPIDVQLDSDDRTMVQPDVIIVCNRDLIWERVIMGAPDLVVEVLSPNTAKKDRFLKLQKYCHAGVREYWLIDIKAKQVIVYWLDETIENRDAIKIYTFHDEIPVGIWDDKCMVDFSQIYEDYQSIFEEKQN